MRLAIFFLIFIKYRSVQESKTHYHTIPWPLHLMCLIYEENGTVHKVGPIMFSIVYLDLFFMYFTKLESYLFGPEGPLQFSSENFICIITNKILPKSINLLSNCLDLIELKPQILKFEEHRMPETTGT